MKNNISFREYVEERKLNLTDKQIEIAEHVIHNDNIIFESIRATGKLEIQKAVFDFCREYRVPFKVNVTTKKRCCTCGHVIKDDEKWVFL